MCNSLGTAPRGGLRLRLFVFVSRRARQWINLQVLVGEWAVCPGNQSNVSMCRMTGFDRQTEGQLMRSSGTQKRVAPREVCWLGAANEEAKQQQKQPSAR